MQSKVPIDVVLMDCEMPNMDGYTATIAIREYEAEHRLPGKPIVALTAHALTEFHKRAANAGMTGYVTKPVQKEALLTALLTAIAMQRADDHGAAHGDHTRYPR
jgi:CheY-like chemotaxis protein